MSPGTVDAKRRFFINRAAIFIAAAVLPVLTHSSRAQEFVPQSHGGVLLGDPSTWPKELSASIRSLSDYGKPVRFIIKLGVAMQVTTSIGQSFWIRMDAAVNKAAVFGEPMYRFTLYDDKRSRVLDYMFTTGTNTVTFLEQNVQFMLAAPAG